MTRSTLLLLLALCSSCTVLSRDRYWSPSSATLHELGSPFPGNPWNTIEAFGSPSDVITLELGAVRLGVSVRNAATRFAFVGPIFPVVPIPLFQTPRTSAVWVWFAVDARADVVVRLDALRLQLPEATTGIPPRGILEPWLGAGEVAAAGGLRRVASGAAAVWDLEFALPGPGAPTALELRIAGIETAEGPLPPAQVQFTSVEGWRVISLP